MSAIVDLLSEEQDIEQIVFSQIVNSQSGETQTRYFLAATSGERFLLITSHSPIDPEPRMDLRQSGLGDTIYARSSDTDFVKNGDLPIVATRPRSQREPLYLEKSFEAQRKLLASCLSVAMGLVKAGSVHWEGDRFTAEYAEFPRGTGWVSFKTADGQDAPESVKAKVLAELEAGPTNRSSQGSFVRCEHRILTAAQAEAERIANTPAPGSIEAKIMAIFEARDQERLRRGIQGHIVRDPQGRVTEVHFEIEPARRVYLDYDASLRLPAPFPHRIRHFIESARPDPEVPCQEITIYSVRLSPKPLDDAVFDPRRHLKEGSFFHGLLGADGTTRVPDPVEQRLLNQMIREKYFRARNTS